MSKIIPFSFDNHQVRAVTRDGEPWFVAADVCAAIGITTEQTRRLDDDEKGLHSTQTPSGAQEMTVINESGLYSLILGSRKPKAKRFKKWVTSEVLPAIRKTGRYEIGAAVESMHPDVVRQMGGMLKTVVRKQVRDVVLEFLPEILHGEHARHQMGVRHGQTAGQIIAAYHLPRIKGMAQMLSRRLEHLDCMIEGGGRVEMGGRTAKLFDPDKVAKVMKHAGLLSECKRYAQERMGQGNLFLVKKAA